MPHKLSLMKQQYDHIIQDLAIVALSIFVAVLLARSDALIVLFTSTREWEHIGSFIAGIFFTSVFTAAPAVVTLGEIAQVYPIPMTAFSGALGALLGDLIIFRFVKDRLSQDLIQLVSHAGGAKRFKALFRLKFFRWLTFLVGGLIIASPLPDEIGISLLGFSKMRTNLFMVLSFVFNFIGIYIIGLIARSIN